MRNLMRNTCLLAPTLGLLATIASVSVSRAYPGDVFTPTIRNPNVP